MSVFCILGEGPSVSVYDVNTQHEVLTHEVFQYERVHGIVTARPESNGQGKCEMPFFVLCDRTK